MAWLAPVPNSKVLLMFQIFKRDGGNPFALLFSVLETLLEKSADCHVLLTDRAKPLYVC